MNAVLNRLQGRLLNAVSIGFDGTVIFLTFSVVGLALAIALPLMALGGLLDRLGVPRQDARR